MELAWANFMKTATHHWPAQMNLLPTLRTCVQMRTQRCQCPLVTAYLNMGMVTLQLVRDRLLNNPDSPLHEPRRRRRRYERRRNTVPESHFAPVEIGKFTTLDNALAAVAAGRSLAHAYAVRACVFVEPGVPSLQELLSTQVDAPSLFAVLQGNPLTTCIDKLI